MSITVVPSTASVVANNTQLFDATVSGANNTTATWQVNGVTGGNSTLGTISSSGLYTAPAVSATMTFTVTAISNDDSTKSASAVVTVSPAIHRRHAPAGCGHHYSDQCQFGCEEDEAVQRDC